MLASSSHDGMSEQIKLVLQHCETDATVLLGQFGDQDQPTDFDGDLGAINCCAARVLG